MNRREALSATALLVGGAIAGAPAFLSGCRRAAGNVQALVGADDVPLLDEVGETIIPTTADSPGAKEARIGAFMVTIVNDCYDEKEQKIFAEGITKLKDLSRRRFGKGFMKLSPDEKKELLTGIDKASKKQDKDKAGLDAAHYFTMMKQLTVWRYFTSQPGATKALRYVPVPGIHKGCIPYGEGEKAWAT